MRYFTAVALALLCLSLFPLQGARADALNSEQLKKLLSGNTLYLKDRTTSGRPREAWQYFQADGTWKYKVEIEGRRRYREFEHQSTWKVSGDGSYCLKNRSNKLSCSSNVRLEGDTVTLDRTLDGESDGKRKYKLLKGNHKSL